MKVLDAYSPINRRGIRNTSDNKDKLKQTAKHDIERGNRMKAGKKSYQDLQDEKELSWFDG